MSPKMISYVIILLLLIRNVVCIDDEEDDKEDADSEEIITDSTTTVTDQTVADIFQVPDENWISSALKDIAYYLRQYKFNEWDRRYYIEKPKEETMIGYYDAYPVPSLRSLHWKVYENCASTFYNCITYLHGIIETAPLTRAEDTTVILNENGNSYNETMKDKLDRECKMTYLNSEKSGLPFDGPIERFQWRTSASYYMCLYTMLEIPVLSMLGERCDNFAACLDLKYGLQNKDVRADDRMSFACARYSFCPDPCCPAKHITSFSKCYEDSINPCYAENFEGGAEERICVFNQKENQNFRDIIANRWNVSCHCKKKNYLWKSQFGMCVDKNECITGEHNCNKYSEDCLNLPGTFKCICKWGYNYDNKGKKCIRKNMFEEPSLDIKRHYNAFVAKLKRFFRNILHSLGM